MLSFAGNVISETLNPLRYVFDWFHELYLPAGFGMGPFPLQASEIESFGRSRKLELRVSEVELLRDLSEAYCEVYYRKEKIKQETPRGMQAVKMTDNEGLKALFSKAGTKKR